MRKTMKKTMKKTIALLLTVVMLLSLSIPMVGAVETTSPTYPTYEAADEGALLYKVNFDENRYAYSNINNQTMTTVPDGNAITLKSNATANGYHSIGGEIAGLPYTGSSVYTVEFTTTLPSTGTIAFAPPAEGANGESTGRYYYAIKNSQITTDADNLNTTWVKTGWKRYDAFSTINAVDGKYTFRFVIDEAKKTVSFYFLDTNMTFVNIPGATGNGFEPTTENLYLALGNYSMSDAVISDVSVYKGNLFDNLVDNLVDPRGELQYAVNFDEDRYAYSNINNQTMTTVPDGNAITLKSNATADGYHSIGGEIAGLPYTGSSVYTVEFTTTLPSTGTIAFAPPAEGANGELTGRYYYAIANYRVTTDADNLNTTWVKTGWKKYSDFSTINNVDGKYTFRLVIDEAKKTVSFYFLDTNMTFVNIPGATGNGFEPTTENLYLAFGNYSKSDAVISDVKIYSTSKFVKVIDGNTEDTIAINEEEYTLPAATKAGYMFKGWRVDDAATITKAGVEISVNGLKKLEAVYEEVMSKTDIRVQFGNKTETTADMRIVGVLDTLSYQAIGYSVVITQENGTVLYRNENFELHNVYTSLSAAYGSKTIGIDHFEYDSGFLTSLVIENVPTNVGEITFELIPYQIDANGNRNVGEPIELSFEDLWSQENALNQ